MFSSKPLLPTSERTPLIPKPASKTAPLSFSETSTNTCAPTPAILSSIFLAAVMATYPVLSNYPTLPEQKKPSYYEAIAFLQKGFLQKKVLIFPCILYLSPAQKKSTFIYYLMKVQRLLNQRNNSYCIIKRKRF